MRYLLKFVLLMSVLCVSGSALAEEKAGAPEAASGENWAREAMTNTLEGRKKLSGTFQEALAKWQKLAEAPILADWEAIEATGVLRSAKIEVAAKDATARQLLEMLLARAARPGRPLGWFIADNTVVVTTQERVLQRRRPARLAAAAEDRADDRPAPRSEARARRVRRPAVLREVDFRKTELVDVLDFIRTASGVNLTANWEALEMIGVSRETPITLKLKNVSYARLLDLVCDKLGGGRDKYSRVYWVVDGGVVTISTGEALDDKLRTVVIDVADLLMVVRDFKGPRIELDREASTTDSGSSGDTGSIFDTEEDTDDEADSPAEMKKEMGRKLIELVKDSIGPEMWQPEGKGSIRLFNDKLIISQTRLGFKLLQESTRLR